MLTDILWLYQAGSDGQNAIAGVPMSIFGIIDLLSVQPHSSQVWLHAYRELFEMTSSDESTACNSKSTDHAVFIVVC